MMEIKKEEPLFDDQVIKITHLPPINHEEYVSNSHRTTIIERPLFENENKTRKHFLKIKEEEVTTSKQEGDIIVEEVSWNTISKCQNEVKPVCRNTLKDSQTPQNLLKLNYQQLKTTGPLNYFFKCEQCPRVFVSHMAMKGHSKVHGGKCKFVRLNNYNRKADPYGNIVHEYDNDKMTVKSKSGAPLRTAPPLNVELNRVYSCYLCDRVFNSAQNLIEHKREHTRNKVREVMKCDRCPYETTVKQNFEKHGERHVAYIRKIHTIKYYKCTQCPQSFRGCETLATHMKHVH